MSPVWRPAFPAGPPGSREATSTPDSRGRSKYLTLRLDSCLCPPSESEVSPADFPVGEDLRHHVTGRVGGHRKADPLGGRDDRRVDPHHPAPGIDQRSTGVAGVQGRGVLDHIFDETTIKAPHGATRCADHAGGDAGLEPQRVADGDHKLAHLERRRVTESRVGQSRTVRADQRQVVRGIRTHGDRTKDRPVGERKLHPVRVPHHMVVRQDIPVRRQEDPRPSGDRLHAVPFRCLPTDRDAYHRGADRLHHGRHRAGIGVQQFDVRLPGKPHLASTGRRRAGFPFPPDPSQRSRMCFRHRSPPLSFPFDAGRKGQDPPLPPKIGGCLRGVCSPCGYPEKHDHIPGRILDRLNESNANERV